MNQYVAGGILLILFFLAVWLLEQFKHPLMQVWGTIERRIK